MPAQEALRRELRDHLGPELRASGFRGSAPTWALGNANGDRAVVNVQSSDYSTKQEVLFTVNLSVVPSAWWRWTNHKLGKSGSRAVKEYDGLWRERLHARYQQAASRFDWWSVIDDATACHAVNDVVEQMQTSMIGRLHQLLEPGAMLAAARTGHLGDASFDTRGAIAVLLTVNGASDELRSLLTDLEVESDPRVRSNFRPVVEWCREAVGLRA